MERRLADRGPSSFCASGAAQTWPPEGGRGTIVRRTAVRPRFPGGFDWSWLSSSLWSFWQVCLAWPP